MATGRRGRKTTAKRKPKKRKAAPARRKKARTAPKKKAAKKKPAKKKRAKAAARKATKRTAKKTKPQGARARMVRRLRRTPAAAPARPPVPESFAPPAPAPAPIPRAAPAAAPPTGDMEVAFERALRMEGYANPDPTAVAVLSAIGRGYAMGPASVPAWLRVDVARPISEVMAERFKIGDRAHDIDRGSHRPTTRASVNIVLAQTTGGDQVDDPERAVLASFCLGSWDPALDPNAERNAIAGFVIPWYMAGRA